jgi:hypothetical protein
MVDASVSKTRWICEAGLGRGFDKEGWKRQVVVAEGKMRAFLPNPSTLFKKRTRIVGHLIHTNVKKLWKNGKDGETHESNVPWS